MAAPPLLNLYLPFQQRDQLLAGNSIFGVVARAVQAAGWTLTLRKPYEPASGPGYHLALNRAVTQPDMLTARCCYLEPFYRIEATNDRWHWEVAAYPFQPEPGTDWFRRHWVARIFADMPITRARHIFMPLQGKLSSRRHFQMKSPLDMIEDTLSAAPDHDIFATLHPRETYSPDEIAALQRIGGRFHLSTAPSLSLLASCDYVVTQNSSLAFLGYFARKPAVLFADIDFHHIARSVRRLGVKSAFDTISDLPDFGAYLHWFLRDNAISLSQPEAQPRITARLRDHGWPI